MAIYNKTKDGVELLRGGKTKLQLQQERISLKKREQKAAKLKEPANG